MVEIGVEPGWGRDFNFNLAGAPRWIAAARLTVLLHQWYAKAPIHAQAKVLSFKITSVAADWFGYRQTQLAG